MGMDYIIFCQTCKVRAKEEIIHPCLCSCNKLEYIWSSHDEDENLWNECVCDKPKENGKCYQCNLIDAFEERHQEVNGCIINLYEEDCECRSCLNEETMKRPCTCPCGYKREE